ncbi:hypothetical protein [Neorhizobium galegae]|uniref:DUF5666 domain-containing protein n=1 Tax=Neorhizobium galegae bv. orientalis str. HAMBI 540 TaxID=1028800 RepID=A0A068SX73_NEOGA|nr:hypothetical protein [Neorhizobium galegae]MCQ1851464.1 hypothetical protein [Neorhizobium galegae]CDN50828.1 Hypothetical protein RG540_PA01490 [Neorhizobium galegae bv. orientalis str. HAMBI 540]
MSRRRLPKIAALLALGLSAFLATISVVDAQSARVRVRGTIVSLDGSVLNVKTREGTMAAVTLNSGLMVSTVVNASLDDIKPGDYVGVASVPKADGGDGALEVLVFPAAMKGTGEGSFAYDLKPNSTMTNATVSNAVKAVEGRELTLTYNGQEKKMAVPAGTPVVTIASATSADLVAGAPVIINSDKAADGSLSTARVIVDTKGVVPPM